MPEDVHQPRASRHRRRHPVLRRALLAAGSFTLLLAVGSAALAGWAYSKYNGQIHRVAVLQPTDPNIAEPRKQLNAENFLLIGSDSRAGADASYGDQPGARSDTTIVVHLSADHRRASVISIPRDSWVEIPRCTSTSGRTVAEHHDLFNAAFSLGGPTCTIATVQKLTGIAVTHFVQVDFAGFRSMVDALGSVTVCSPKTLTDSKSGLHLTKGTNHLGGKQALAYVRARETLGDGSDLGRIKRQQRFMGAVLRQALSGSLLSNPIRLNEFVDAATKAITVDKATSVGDLRTLGSTMGDLDPKQVQFYTAPIADQDYSPPGTSYSGKVLLDTAKGRVLYRSVIDDVPAASTATPSPTAPSGSTSSSVAAPEPNANGDTTTCSL